MKLKNISIYGLVLGAAFALSACTKDFLDRSPKEFLEENAVIGAMQEDLSQVQALVTGAYYNLYSGTNYQPAHDVYGMGALKLVMDVQTEDIAYYRDVHYFCYDYQLDYWQRTYRRATSTWQQLYQVIDNVNQVISILKPADGAEPASQAAKIMLGEALSMRAFCYYHLVNIYQHPITKGRDLPGVPLKTETEYRQERVPVGEVYDQILADIDAGYKYLKGEGFHNGKVGLSEFAAAAIYARVLMFTGDYANAASYAEAAIVGGPLNSAADMTSGFNSLNMPEVLWGYGVNSETTLIYASFMSHADPYSPGYGGAVGVRKLMPSELLDAMAENDVRRAWAGYKEEWNIDGVDFKFERDLGFDKYIQNKYVDIRNTSGGNAGAFTSDILYMRSAEMYFVAAEAYMLAGQNDKALASLNKIMATRVPDYNFAGTGDALRDEIYMQKRIECFMDGVRLFDAKRRGETIDRSKSVNHALDLVTVFDAVKYKADEDNRLVYEIPNAERENNPEMGE